APGDGVLPRTAAGPAVGRRRPGGGRRGLDDGHGRPAAVDRPEPGGPFRLLRALAQTRPGGRAGGPVGGGGLVGAGRRGLPAVAGGPGGGVPGGVRAGGRRADPGQRRGDGAAADVLRPGGPPAAAFDNGVLAIPVAEPAVLLRRGAARGNAAAG